MVIWVEIAFRLVIILDGKNARIVVFPERSVAAVAGSPAPLSKGNVRSERFGMDVRGASAIVANMRVPNCQSHGVVRSA